MLCAATGEPACIGGYKLYSGKDHYGDDKLASPYGSTASMAACYALCLQNKASCKFFKWNTDDKKYASSCSGK